jgi:hypothetical protein
VLLAAGLLLPLWPAAGQGYAPPGSVPAAAAQRRFGQGWCFDRQIVIAGIAIASGRCYNFYALRTNQGSFLGLGPSGAPMIPPGQLVRMNTPAGLKLKGRLFYMLPITTALNIPVNSLQFVNVLANIVADRIVFTLPQQTGGRVVEGRVSDERP